MTRLIRRFGAAAALVELADTTQVLALRRGLATAAQQGDLPVGIGEVVPAARTLLLRYDPAEVDWNTVHTFLATLELAKPPPADSGPTRGPAEHNPPSRLAEAVGEPEIVIPVTYTGADLADVAGQTGLSVNEVIARHCAVDYQVAFCGFTAGFAYLVGGDPQLTLPRRATPRPKVPAGSVAIADVFSAVYPRESPGGWHLLGHTTATLWDVTADPPALLRPGARVRFFPTDSAESGSSARSQSAP